MAGVKTAISIDEELFSEVNRLAQDMHVSRSRLITIAVKDYLKKRENLSLLAQLNETYGDHPDEEEKKISKTMRTKHGKTVEQESW